MDFIKCKRKNFWQIYFGKDPFLKPNSLKPGLMVGDCYCPARCTVDLYFIKFEGIGIALGFGFCQIHARYLTFVGWNKFIGVLGVFPVTNIILFIVLLFTKKK